MAHAQPSQGEQNANNAITRAHRRRACPKCGRTFAEDDPELTARVLTISSDDLIRHMKLHESQAFMEDGSPQLRAALIDYFDGVTQRSKLDPERVLQAFVALERGYPVLFAFVRAKLETRTNRDIAREVGGSDHRVAEVLGRAHHVWAELYDQLAN